MSYYWTRHLSSKRLRLEETQQYFYFCFSILTFFPDYNTQGRIQGVRTPALLIRVFFFQKNGVNKYHRECIKNSPFWYKKYKKKFPPRPHRPRRLGRSTSGASFRWIGRHPAL